VDTPTLLLAEPLNLGDGPGEQVNHFVVRDRGSKSRRIVVPPRVSPSLGHLHGQFDRHQKGAFRDYIWNEDGSFATVAQFRGHDEPATPDEQNMIFTPAEWDIDLQQPYFPDPAADSACVSLLHRRSVTEARNECVAFYPGHKWPDAKAFSIVLADAKDGQTEDAVMERSHHHGHDTLSIRLKPGRTAKLVLSSSLLRSLSPVFYFHDELQARIKKAFRLSTQTAPQTELHWLLVSQTELQLVHAVRKPLGPPSFTSFDVAYEPCPNDGKLPPLDKNSVCLKMKMHLDVDSTGQIEVTATWEDEIDDCKQPEVQKKNSSAHVLSRQIKLDAISQPQENDPEFAFEHNIGDTKHHTITYSISGTSRFASYYRQDKNSVKAGHFQARDQKNDVRCCILNRARPKKPEVLYLIPSFAWEDIETADGRGNRRLGGGIRVYGEGAWGESTGNGELLAVLLDQGNTPAEAQELSTYMGKDPIWDGGSVSLAPSQADFSGNATFELCGSDASNPQTKLADLTLEEHKAAKVTAIGYKPICDRERKLWYCDITLSPRKAYHPFVRFAFARMQPNSLPDCHLSSVVTADFAQIAPDRCVIARKQKRDISVAVYGYTYTGSAEFKTGSLMMIRLEQKVAGMNENFCWIPAVDDTTKKEIVKIVQPAPPSALEKLGWFKAKPADIPSDVCVWRADMGLPDRLFATDYRIRVEEIETFKSDDRSSGKKLGDTKDCGRIIFADALEI
jgi:hypothetical protein